jgi:hypothetical protein
MSDMNEDVDEELDFPDSDLNILLQVTYKE